MQRWPNDQVKLETHAFIICMGVHFLGAMHAVVFRTLPGCQCQQEMGKIPNFTDSERLKTPKTDCALKSLQRQRILSAWILGLLTLKITGSVPT